MSTTKPNTSRTVVVTTTRNNRRKAAKKQNSKKKKRATRGRIIQNAPPGQFYISPCSRKYIEALLNPFNLKGGQACIPDLLDFPSFKPLVVGRGVFEAGSTLGYVFVNTLANNNDQTQVVVTTASYLNADVQIVVGTPGTVGFNLVQQPYGAASVDAAGVSTRTVGMGLRVRYIGTTLNQSGRIIPYRANSAIASVNGLNLPNILSRAEIPTIPCDRKWHSVTYLPMSSSDMQYVSIPVSINRALGTNAGLGFLVSGSTPGNAWEYEVYQHMEIKSSNGILVPTGVTPSHSDVPGMSAIRNVLESNLPVGDGPTVLNQALKLMSEVSAEDISHVVSGFGALSSAVHALGWA